MSNPTSQAIEKSAETADAMIAHHKSDFATVLPSHIKADQWVTSLSCRNLPDITNEERRSA